MARGRRRHDSVKGKGRVRRGDKDDGMGITTLGR